VVNRGGQLVISLLLLRLVREAVGVKQLHQLASATSPAESSFFSASAAHAIFPPQ
jgi:hypothetical protein